MNKLANYLLVFALFAVAIVGAVWTRAATKSGNYELNNEQRLALKLARSEAVNAQMNWNQANDALQAKMRAFYDACDGIRAAKHLPKEAHCDIQDVEPALKAPVSPPPVSQAAPAKK